MIDQIAVQDSLPALNVLTVSLQVAVVVLIAWSIFLLLNRKPGKQHFVWLAALIAIAVAIPVQLVTPHLGLVIRPVVATATETNPKAIADRAHWLDSVPSEMKDTAMIGVNRAETRPVVPATPSVSPNDEVGVDNRQAELLAARSETQSAGWQLRNFMPVLLLIYPVVVVVLAVRLGLGWLVLWQTRRACSIWSTDPWVDDIARKLRLKDRPPVLVSDSIQSPMTFGVFRPVVLVPKGFANWKSSCQEVVVYHEFCHIKRRDAAWDWLARIVRLVYWFHPAVHFACHSLRRTREVATDMAVLDLGVAPTLYARELLNVTTRSTADPSVLALPMASRQSFEKRIRRILGRAGEPGKTTVRRPYVFQALIMAMFLLIAGFSIQFTQAKQQEGDAALQSDFPEEVSDDQVKGVRLYTRIAQTRCRKPAQDQDVNEISNVSIWGQILDAARQPASDAIVILRNGHAMSARRGNRINDILAKTRTDQEGNFTIENAVVHQRLVQLEVVAISESGDMAWQDLHLGKRRRLVLPDVRIQLEKSVRVEGFVADATDKAVAGATVTLQGFRRETGARRRYAGYTDRVIAPTTVTGQDGGFVFPAMPAGYVATFTVKHPDFATDYVRIRTSDAHKAWIVNPGNGERVPVLDSGARIQLEKGVLIGATLVSSDKQPIPEAAVDVLGCSTTSDGNGRFQIAVKKDFLPPDREHRVTVEHEDYGLRTFKLDGPELQSGKAVIQVQQPGQLTGRVLAGDDRRPVANVSLLMRSSQGIGRVLRTDEDGNFSWPTVAPGTVTLKLFGRKSGFDLVQDSRSIDAEKHKHLIHEFELEAGQTRNLDPILLKRLAPVEARIVDASGEFLKGVEVQLLTLDRFGHYKENSEVEVTAMDGQCELAPFGDPLAGSIVSATRVLDGQVWAGRVLVSPETQVAELALEPAVELRGKITLNGEPLPGIRLRVSSHTSSEEQRLGVTVNRISATQNFGYVTTNQLGEYTLPVPKNGLDGAASSYFVGVTSGIPNDQSTGRSYGAKQDASGNYVLDIDFLKGDRQISGVIVDTEGNPVEGVSVIIQRQYDRTTGRPVLEPARFYLPSVVQSDENGKFTFDGIPSEGEFRLRTGFFGGSRRSAPRIKSQGKVSAKSGDANVRIEVELEKQP